MTHVLKWIWQHAFPLPAVGRLEALLARALLAWVLIEFFPVFTPPAVQPVPVGLAHWFDLTWLGHAPTFLLYRQVSSVCWWSMCWGRGCPWCCRVLAIMQILPYTLTNSQGFTNHSHHILSVVLLAQALVAVCFPRRVVATARGHEWLAARGQSGRHRHPLISFPSARSCGPPAACGYSTAITSRSTW